MGQTLTLASEAPRPLGSKDLVEIESLVKNAITGLKSEEIQDYLTIYESMAKIVRRQGDPLSKRKERSRAEYVTPFLKWCQTVGVQYKGLRVDVFPGRGFGLTASQNLGYDECVIKIPFEAMIHTDAAEAEFGDWSKSISALVRSPLTTLALKVLNERLLGSKSYYKPYVDIFPKNIVHPLLFSPKDFLYLNGSLCHEQAMHRAFELCYQYIDLYNNLVNDYAKGIKYGAIRPSNFTFELYRWAFTIAQTRALTVYREDSGNSVTVLVPFWDLCNHGDSMLYTQGELNEDPTNKQNELTKNTTREIAAGEQISIIYRDGITPIEFFNLWGFILVDTYGPIKVDLDPKDVNFDVKRATLTWLDGLTIFDFTSNYSELHIHPYDCPLPKEDLQVLLIISATTTDIHNQTISMETWTRAWNHMLKRINRRLTIIDKAMAPRIGQLDVEASKPAAQLAMGQVNAEAELLQKAKDNITYILPRGPTCVDLKGLIFMDWKSEKNDQVDESDLQTVEVVQADPEAVPMNFVLEAKKTPEISVAA